MARKVTEKEEEVVVVEVPEKGKYEAMVIKDKKGKNGKPLIYEGKGFQITLSE